MVQTRRLSVLVVLAILALLAPATPVSAGHGDDPRTPNLQVGEEFARHLGFDPAEYGERAQS